jgi:ATP-binding cassette subfamily B protein RaxB
MTRSARILLLTIVCAASPACRLNYTGGAKHVDPISVADGSWLHAAPTPVVRQQQDSDCGLAALAMVAGRWGQTWSVDDLAQHIPVTEAGVKLGALRDFARLRGLTAYAISGSTRDLAHELGAGRPVLLGLVLPFDHKHNRSHFEVAVAMDPADGEVVTIDPASGEWMKRPAKILDVEWKAAGYAALVVTGPAAAKAVADAH